MFASRIQGPISDAGLGEFYLFPVSGDWVDWPQTAADHRASAFGNPGANSSRVACTPGTATGASRRSAGRDPPGCPGGGSASGEGGGRGRSGAGDLCGAGGRGCSSERSSICDTSAASEYFCSEIDPL